MLRWPTRAAVAIRRLFEPLQPIDVYVEDEKDEPFYKALVNHATASAVPIARVYGLGGKRAVLERASAHDFSSRRALFIVDGDFTWLDETRKNTPHGVHRHNAYCVENLLLCNRAISVVFSQETSVDEEVASRTLKLEELWVSLRQPLVDLYASYLVAQEFNCEFVTVAYGIGKMCVQPKGRRGMRVDPKKIQDRVRSVLETLKKSEDPALVDARFRDVQSKLLVLDDPLLAVSGKDALLPLVVGHLAKHSCTVRTSSFRHRLATLVERARLAELGDAVLRAARGA